MNFRFINNSVHGILDYAVAIVLVLVPLSLNFQTTSAIAHWLSIVAGAALLLYSLFTNYSLSVTKLLPFNFHLVLDFLAGVAFIVAPFLFQFEGLPRVFYLVMGIAVVVVVLLTDSGSPINQGTSSED